VVERMKERKAVIRLRRAWGMLSPGLEVGGGCFLRSVVVVVVGRRGSWDCFSEMVFIVRDLMGLLVLMYGGFVNGGK
jgi:hypothetical protein